VKVQNIYKLLRVDPEAELETIRHAYLNLSRQYDPANEETGNPYQFRQVMEAWKILSKESSRARYDRLLIESER
jgi:DnaJ-class molecular chaperone